jgi:hypothetical protein
MEMHDQITSAYNRMLMANEDLQAYLSGAIPDSTEYERVFASVKVATKEYQGLIKRFLDQKYLARIAREEKRSA